MQTTAITATLFTIIFNLAILAFYGALIYFFMLAVKALRKYLKSGKPERKLLQSADR